MTTCYRALHLCLSLSSLLVWSFFPEYMWGDESLQRKRYSNEDSYEMMSWMGRSYQPVAQSSAWSTHGLTQLRWQVSQLQWPAASTRLWGRRRRCFFSPAAVLKSLTSFHVPNEVKKQASKYEDLKIHIYMGVESLKRFHVVLWNSEFPLSVLHRKHQVEHNDILKMKKKISLQK